MAAALWDSENFSALLTRRRREPAAAAAAAGRGAGGRSVYSSLPGQHAGPPLLRDAVERLHPTPDMRAWQQQQQQQGLQDRLPRAAAGAKGGGRGEAEARWWRSASLGQSSETGPPGRRHSTSDASRVVAASAAGAVDALGAAHRARCQRRHVGDPAAAAEEEANFRAGGGHGDDTCVAATPGAAAAQWKRRSSSHVTSDLVEATIYATAAQIMQAGQVRRTGGKALCCTMAHPTTTSLLLARQPSGDHEQLVMRRASRAVSAAAQLAAYDAACALRGGAGELGSPMRPPTPEESAVRLVSRHTHEQPEPPPPPIPSAEHLSAFTLSACVQARLVARKRATLSHWEADAHAHTLATDVAAAGGRRAYEQFSGAGPATEAAPPLERGCSISDTSLSGLGVPARGESVSRRRELHPQEYAQA